MEIIYTFEGPGLTFLPFSHQLCQVVLVGEGNGEERGADSKSIQKTTAFTSSCY